MGTHMKAYEINDIRECLESAINESYYGATKECFLADIDSIFRHVNYLRQRNTNLTRQITVLKEELKKYKKETD